MSFEWSWDCSALQIIDIFWNWLANIMIVNLIKIDIVNETLQRTLINKMSINYDTQISKNTLDHSVMGVNKINRISEDHRNSEDDIGSDVEHRIHKRSYNRLISLKQVLESDIIFFDKHKTSADFHESELWFKFPHIILFEKTFDIN